MIYYDFLLPIEHGHVKVNNATKEQLIDYLLDRVWGRLVMYCESEVGIWLVKSYAWPFITASGAGRSLEEALIRCAMCLGRRLQNATANRVRNLEDLI